jgi:hypothetical protein
LKNLTVDERRLESTQREVIYMVEVVTIDGKALLASKQFWLMVLTMIVTIFASPVVLNVIPNGIAIGAVIVEILSIVIRTMTDAPITGFARA